MKRDYARHYRDLYERHWWWRSREALLLRELRRHRPAEGWGSILDVGCGDGLFFAELSKFGDVWGVEPDGELLSSGNPHRDRIHVGPFDASFGPGRKFRLMLMLDVLEHLPKPADALRQAAAILEPDGRLLVTVPAFRALWTAHDDFNQHVDRYTASGLRDLARESGFEVESSRYLFHFLFPLKLAVRAMEAIMPGRAVPEQVPRPWVNRLMLNASLAEEQLLGRLRVPFGTSVLAWFRPRHQPTA